MDDVERGPLGNGPLDEPAVNIKLRKDSLNERVYLVACEFNDKVSVLCRARRAVD
jgi:hypothetical protein